MWHYYQHCCNVAHFLVASHSFLVHLLDFNTFFNCGWIFTPLILNPFVIKLKACLPALLSQLRQRLLIDLFIISRFNATSSKRRASCCLYILFLAQSLNHTLPSLHCFHNDAIFIDKGLFWDVWYYDLSVTREANCTARTKARFWGKGAMIFVLSSFRRVEMRTRLFDSLSLLSFNRQWDRREGNSTTSEKDWKNASDEKLNERTWDFSAL